jgi:hypothetical protein
MTLTVRSLLVKARQVDTIIALDASADTNYNWPNATSLYATRDRIAVLNNGQSFPELPPNFTALVSAGLNTRPVFYGCNVSDPNTYPLIAYLPNAPTTVNAAMTNYSTFTLEYSNADASAFLRSVPPQPRKSTRLKPSQRRPRQRRPAQQQHLARLPVLRHRRPDAPAPRSPSQLDLRVVLRLVLLFRRPPPAGHRRQWRPRRHCGPQRRRRPLAADLRCGPHGDPGGGVDRQLRGVMTLDTIAIVL